MLRNCILANWANITQLEQLKSFDLVYVYQSNSVEHSIADTADSSVAVSGDLMEYFGSGIVDRSIRPILSPHFTVLYNNFSRRRYGDGAPNLVSFP